MTSQDLLYPKRPSIFDCYSCRALFYPNILDVWIFALLFFFGKKGDCTIRELPAIVVSNP